ncbi:MAG TPA: type II secretion system protein [Rhodanobacteraceae bacterium]|nr:type II secretion system protein [Rhodanobacteraceae bacterium]
MIPSAPRKHEQGFSLIEALIVLTLLVGLSALVMMGMKTMTQSSSRENFVSVQAREMSLIRAAAKQYVTTNGSLFTAGTPKTIAITDLITAGLLPTDFAKRNGTIGTSPMFQPYVVIGLKDATGKVPIVVTEGSTPLGSRLQQMGMAANDAMVLAYKQQVAEEANKAFKVVAGTVDKGSTVAKGVYGGFTKDLAAFLGAATSAANAVVLQGFSDLEVNPVDVSGSNKWKSCVFKQTDRSYYAGNKYVLPSCPAGYTEVARTPFCNYKATSLVYPSDVGSLFLSKREIDSRGRAVYQWSCDINLSPTCTPQPYYTDTESWDIFFDIQLNGATIATDGVCDWSHQTQGTWNPSAWRCDASDVPSIYAKPCISNTGRNEAQQAFADIGQNPYDLLCCAPN